MNNANHYLLASHGTDGAQAAERMLFDLCVDGSSIHHLVVVDEMWKDMTGDDWLNNGSTRDTFRNYLEAELEGEIREHVQRVQQQAVDRDIEYSAEVMVGKPEKCLLEASAKSNYDMVIMGSPRPKGVEGLRSRMKTEPLSRSLNCPLMIVPYPNA